MSDPKNPAITGAQARNTFLEFFAERGHTIVPSASLIPDDDPTLLFSNSGMVQFKDVFLGTGRRPYTRAADYQKCMRVSGKHNDIDDVGRDGSHHTFFEMLGNWSFGDYYKTDAITWAWKLLTEVWNLPKDRLWATCFQDEHSIIPRDDEAANCWLQQPGFDPDHLLFFGRTENFWEMAETGPCGPDSELHFDLGPEHCNMQDTPGHVCRVNGDCSRLLELWNLVFIQYNRISQTVLDPLPEKHVDTGMGLERIVALLQGSNSNYQTDLFSPLLNTVQQLANHSAEDRASCMTAYRVIADHARAATFLIADGVIPGNTGRNYVCRMVIRRASRFGTRAGFTDPFLAEVAKTVVKEYGQAYPELARTRALILRTITDEEKRFHRTVDLGVSQLTTMIGKLQKRKRKQLAGEEAFELHATYGLPLEITRDILREHNLSVADDDFQSAMEAHRLASGAGQLMGELDNHTYGSYMTLLDQLQINGLLADNGVDHHPYGTLEMRSPLLALLVNGQNVESAKVGEVVEVVLERSPFYVESGGQVSDTGTIFHQTRATDDSKWVIEITDMRRPISALVTHIGKVVKGSPQRGDPTIARVDSVRRWDIMRNHTATHVLHSMLRSLLGDHVRQSGSLVTPSRLRFDFTHDTTLTETQLVSLSNKVNSVILANHTVTAITQLRKEALSAGAVALFGEKYGDVVRSIRIGGTSKTVSFELCGGTHVHQTGDIGPFTLVSEASVAAGVRRIEALTGRASHQHIESRLSVLRKAAAHLRVSPDEVDDKTLNMIGEQKDLQKSIDILQRAHAQQEFDHALDGMTDIEGIAVLSASVTVAETQLLRDMTDWFRQRVPSGVAVFGANINGRPNLIAAVTNDLTKVGLHAGSLVGEVARLVGGRGGGKPTLAQAGGTNPESLPDAIAIVHDLVAQTLLESRKD